MKLELDGLTLTRLDESCMLVTGRVSRWRDIKVIELWRYEDDETFTMSFDGLHIDLDDSEASKIARLLGIEIRLLADDE